MKRTQKNDGIARISDLGLLSMLMLAMLMLASGCSMAPAEEVAQQPPTTQAEAPNNIAVAEIATLPPPLVMEASDTPVPATNTPEATSTAEPTDTPEATDVPATETAAPTNTPAPIVPTNPPPPTATDAPPPTAPPPQIGANGLVASHFALQDRSDYHAGGKVWFEFDISNSTGDEVSYNAIGVMPKKDSVDRFEWYQQTYGGRNSTINAGGFSWEDRIELPESGDYTLRLVICFDGYDNCLQGGGAWHNLSQEIAVTIN